MTPSRRTAVEELPTHLAPQLATLVGAPPTGKGWTYEIKFDGYRILARCAKGQTKLFTRNGHDWTAKMVSLAAAVSELVPDSVWLDGEVVVLDENGLPSFNRLQNAFDGSNTEQLVYFVFDVLYFEGTDLRPQAFASRRKVLESLFAGHEDARVQLSKTFGDDGASVLQSACKLGLEGVIAKRLDAPYASRRTADWLKVKCQRRQEFVIGGFTTRANASKEIGSLLLGIYDDGGALRSVGSVGTGWNSATAAAMLKQLQAIEVAKSPFDPMHAPAKGRWSRRATGSEHWVKPARVAEVNFGEWTSDGHIRHASFVGMREDKTAKSIRREATLEPSKPAVRVSHPDRVIDPSTGITKGALVAYYEAVAERMLPHLAARPVSLLRAPSGITGKQFFQKHAGTLRIPGGRSLDPSLWPGYDALLEVPTAEALVGAAQMNVIEFHTWNSVVKTIDKPDRMIFDLDPGEGVSWKFVQDAASLTQAMLEELHLSCWLKTSGGKGLHVVVPLTPKESYETVKGVSGAIVRHLAGTIPARFVSKSGRANRVGKIYVDYLRNGLGATTAAAFSARARAGLGVSMPVAWAQLPAIKSGDQWTIANTVRFLEAETEDPWKSYWTTKQTLSKAIKVLRWRPVSTPDSVRKRASR